MVRRRVSRYPSWMKKLVLICLAAAIYACSFAASASAVTLVNPDGSVAQPYQSWADLSNVPTVDETITVTTDMTICGPSPTIHGCTQRGVPVIHLRPKRCGYGTWRECRFVFMHELGHQFDFQMAEWKRDRFQATLSGTSASSVYGPGFTFGWNDPSPPDGGSMAEDFADAYAKCAFHDHAIVIYGRAMIDPTKQQLRRVCHLIEIPNA